MLPRTVTLLGLAAAIAGASFGAAAGVGGYVFVYSEGASYLTDDPRACANCHVMSRHLDAWAKSSHHAVAVCNNADPGPDDATCTCDKLLP